MLIVYGGGGILGALLGGGLGAGAGIATGAASGAAHGKDVGPAGTAALLGFFGGIMGMFLGAALVIGLISMVLLIWEGLTGRSPGKLVFGMRVGAGDGSPAPVPVLLVRAGIKHIAGALALVSAIPGLKIVAGFSPMAQGVVNLGMLLALGASRQALHDRVAGTAVYRTR